MNYVTTSDNSKLYVKDWGTGKPVILLSGWPLSADSWDDQAMVIAGSGFRVIAYDHRGFGRSSFTGPTTRRCPSPPPPKPVSLNRR